MATEQIDKKNNTMADSFYGRCPICKYLLVQAKNGMDGIIKCPKCGNYIHIIVKDDMVITKRNYAEEE